MKALADLVLGDRAAVGGVVVEGIEDGDVLHILEEAFHTSAANTTTHDVREATRGR